MNNEKLNPSVPSPAALASQVNPDYAIQRVENSPLLRLFAKDLKKSDIEFIISTCTRVTK